MSGDSDHIIPIKTLARIFVVLVGLTLLTVITAKFVDLGRLNVPLALAIAGVKVLLVASVFMALKYDKPVNMVVISLGVIFAVVFMAITLTDTALRGFLGLQPAGEIPYVVPGVEHHGDDDPVAVDDPVEPAPVPVETAPGRSGQEIYVQYCQSCHTLEDTGVPGVGPPFAGIGALRSRDNIIQSIREPDAEIVEGYAGMVMTATLNALNFYTDVSNPEFEALVEFIQEQ